MSVVEEQPAAFAVERLGVGDWPDCGEPADVPARSAPKLPDLERRTVQFKDAEIRSVNESLIFEGHAAVFDSWSEDLGGFRERIKPGAFRKALGRSPDVRFMLNHDPNLVMARSTISEGPGSLVLKEDRLGLAVKAELAPTSTAKDLRVLTQTGVIDQMSFGFTMRGGGEDSWDSEYSEREIHTFGDIYDVSPVVMPAYAATDASMRSLVCGVEIISDGQVQEDYLRAVANRIQRGSLVVSAEERGRVDSAFAQIDCLSPWMEELARRTLGLEPAEINASPTETEMTEGPVSPVGQWRLAARKRRLRIAQL